MVMFSCNRCSKGLKKKEVLNHSFQCGGRNNINVTCIDCLKDFTGNAYDSHTSCVTEEERYGGKGVIAKETGKKQNQWLGIVRQVLNVNQSLRQPVKKFLQSIQHMENIPRNKKKFHNWAYSAMHMKDTKFLDEVFEILSIEFRKSTETNTSKEKPQNGTNDSSDLKIASDSVEDRMEVQEDEGNTSKLEDMSDQTKENGERADKKKKKKNKGIIRDGAALEALENGSNNLTIENRSENCEKPKKKRKHSVQTEEEPADTSLGEGSNDLPTENGTEDCEKPKKKRKHSVQTEEPDGNATLMEQDDGTKPDSTEDCQKLSKKERKLKKKKAKFQAELKEIENFTKEEETGDGAVEEETQKSKKSKKRKLVDEGDVVQHNVEGADAGNKKPKVDEAPINEDGDNESPSKGSAGSPSKKQKFDWHEMIVNVLKNSKDDEVSVKKVTKKVINEYVSLYGDKGIHEKLNAKMTKKLKTCPNVRVLKDKVRLVQNEE